MKKKVNLNTTSVKYASTRDHFHIIFHLGNNSTDTTVELIYSPDRFTLDKLCYEVSVRRRRFEKVEVKRKGKLLFMIVPD